MQGGGDQDTTISSINITTEFPSDSPSHSDQVLSSGLLPPLSPTFRHRPLICMSSQGSLIPISDNSTLPRRASVACANCRRIKLRCDRAEPCGECAKKRYSVEQYEYGCEPCRRARCADGKPYQRCRRCRMMHGRPPSPVLSDLSDSGSVWNPPSPTLSNHPGRFLSTLQLRDNKPEENSGLSSLGLLNPDNFDFNRYLMSTDCKLDSSDVRREMMIQKRKSKSMIQGKEITISGGKLINVGGDYHEHNTTYVIEEAPAYRGYLETFKDRYKNLETIVNNLLSSPREDNTKSDDSSTQTINSPSRVENENMGDTSSSNHVTELRFNSLNDPQSTSDGYCIYQTPTPSKIGDFTPNSRTTFSAMAQDGRNLPSGNQQPYPFGYLPVLVPGIVHYSPCWLPSWGGWIASWISWISPPSWIWSSFL